MTGGKTYVSAVTEQQNKAPILQASVCELGSGREKDRNEAILFHKNGTYATQGAQYSIKVRGERGRSSSALCTTRSGRSKYERVHRRNMCFQQ